MPKTQIDREKVHVALRRMDDEIVRSLLDDAIDLLPQTKLIKLIEHYVDPSDLRPDRRRKGVLLTDMKEFQRASLNGEYYESFRVNSKNFMDMSRGTEVWIDECNRLLDCCIAESANGDTAETRDAFEIIFSLLEHIDDECLDDIIFFADEAGSWQVGVEWNKVLPAWFKCLSETAEPELYACRIVEIVDKFDDHNRAKHLAAARRIATPAQKKALRGA
jgi:hypothetical protein